MTLRLESHHTRREPSRLLAVCKYQKVNRQKSSHQPFALLIPALQIGWTNGGRQQQQDTAHPETV